MWVPDIPAVEMQAADIGAAGKQVAEMQAETWSAVREQVQVPEQAELKEQVQVLQQMQVQEREPGQEQVQVPAVRQVQSWLRVFRSFRKRPVRPERRFRMIHNT